MVRLLIGTLTVKVKAISTRAVSVAITKSSARGVRREDSCHHNEN